MPIVFISCKGWAKKTFLHGKACFNSQYCKHIHLVFDILRTSSSCVSIMMLTVELKITGSPVSLHVLSKQVVCWLVCGVIVHHHDTHDAENTCHCHRNLQDFVNYINNQLACGQWCGEFVVNIDETNINFEMASGFTLADKGRKNSVLKYYRNPHAIYCLDWSYSEWRINSLHWWCSRGCLMQRLLGSLVVCQHQCIFVCQEKVWMNHREFKILDQWGSDTLGSWKREQECIFIDWWLLSLFIGQLL